ncbi:MAG: hypothetical protein ACLQPV_02215, partial [Vulcanimicrobiaceae bacterium]
TDFVRAQAVRVRDLARALGARTAIVVSRDPGGYYRAGVERSDAVADLLAKENGVLLERRFPGSRENVELMVLR